MNYRKYISFLLPLLAICAFVACKKQWDERGKVDVPQLETTLMQQIKLNGNLSTFAGFIEKLGIDKVLGTSKTYTVWAPSNTALAALDPAIVADTAKLRVFVNNHIASQIYLSTANQATLLVHNLNGKVLTLTSNTVNEATVTSANIYVQNGVLNVIDKPIEVKLTISAYIRGLTDAGLLHKAYILRQDTTFTDTSTATVQSIDPKTGKPILVPGTGIVSRNNYFNKVAALASEDSVYTYFVLTDNAYNAERNKVAKYFTTSTGSQDTTMNILAAFNVLKDVAVRGAYSLANLPATLTSVNGVQVPIDKSSIVRSYNASNGIVYVMNKLDVPVASKITPITIQGERASFYARSDQGSRIAIRTRKSPDGTLFNDLYITSGSLASFFSAYKLSNLYTCQYKVIIRAVNDTAYTHIPMTVVGSTTPWLSQTIQQYIKFGPSTPASVPVVGGVVNPLFYVGYGTGTAPAGALLIKPYDYSELTISPALPITAPPATSPIDIVSGNLNVKKYMSINMYLQGSSTTATNTNNIVVDYIKLIPILQ